MAALKDQSIYSQGFARVAAVSLPVRLGDTTANADRIITAARDCAATGAALVVFPEMSITGYSIDDLVHQEELLDSTVKAIDKIANQTASLPSLLVVGAPLRFGDALYNCAVILQGGNVIGVSPKSYLPSYREFYDKRYFSTLGGNFFETEPLEVVWDSGLRSATTKSAKSNLPEIGTIPFGSFQVEALDIPGFRLAVEICEDLWVPIPPSSFAALQGATVIANPSASPATVGRARRREELVKAQSASSISAYVFTAAGFGESSNDLSWDGQSLIAESGHLLAHSPRFRMDQTITTADIDLLAIRRQRLIQHTFADNAKHLGLEHTAHVISLELGIKNNRAFETSLDRQIDRFPFFAGDKNQVDSDCYEAFAIQTSALVRRMVSLGKPKLIIGVSGGLDSTQALLVAAKAMDNLGRPRTDILAYTMPGFGTSTLTRENAERLCLALGVTFKELDIRPAAQAMLEAMNHPAANGAPVYDVVFENIQAGLRTDYLFRLAGQEGGFVVGTGDLSELALGWCTYGVGDQMSHYGVNAGLPKTMIQHLVRWVAKNQDFAVNHTGEADARTDNSEELTQILESILGTEISPELVPTTSDSPQQSTQAVIGPYELQDFTLYYLLNHGFTPKRIAYLCSVAWGEKYSDFEIVEWIEVFHRRFFTNQYKRTAVPNSPKIMAAGSLSPRGDWRMPSDALSTQWLEEIEDLKRSLNEEEPEDSRRPAVEGTKK